MLREVQSIAWKGSVPVEFIMEGDEVCSLVHQYIYISLNLFRVSIRDRISVRVRVSCCHSGVALVGCSW